MTKAGDCFCVGPVRLTDWGPKSLPRLWFDRVSVMVKYHNHWLPTCEIFLLCISLAHYFAFHV